MQRLLVIYNPTSSQYVHVKGDILARLPKLKSFIIGKFAIKKTNFEQNVKELTKILKNGDLVLAAGGDATAAIAANAIMNSGKTVNFAVLPYGNFNDLARTAGTKTFDDVFAAKPQKFYPLSVYVNGKFWRYATCYVTIGMTAASVKLFDEPKVRAHLREGHKSSWRSYIELAKWYFKNRHKQKFLPNDFTVNGLPQIKNASDYAAVNGRSMSRVMRGGEDYKDPRIFRSEVDRLTSFPRLFALMAKSIISHVPGSPTKKDLLAFKTPAAVELQAEGESAAFQNVTTIEVRKDQKCLNLLQI